VVTVAVVVGVAVVGAVASDDLAVGVALLVVVGVGVGVAFVVGVGGAVVDVVSTYIYLTWQFMSTNMYS
jgi:hypothetical protein